MKLLEYSSYFLTVLNITASQPNVTIEEGRTAPLQCKVTCSKAMDVWTFWLFNGNMIEARPFRTGNKQDLSNTVTNISTLVLKNAMLSQTGVYTCGANSTGVLRIQNISVTVKDLEGPNLDQAKSNINAADGENVTLSCIAVYPKAFFIGTFWIFNGSRIYGNNKYEERNTFLWLEPSHQGIRRIKIELIIYNVGLNDSGEYTCALNTSLGLHLKNVSVNVTRRPGSQPDFRNQQPTEMPQREADLLGTTLFIGVGLFVGLVTTIIVSMKLWRWKRPRPPESS